MSEHVETFTVGRVRPVSDGLLVLHQHRDGPLEWFDDEDAPDPRDWRVLYAPDWPEEPTGGLSWVELGTGENGRHRAAGRG